MGLDFGTSTTKILYRTREDGTERTFSLPASDGPVVRGSLVPSLAVVTSDGRMLLGAAAEEWLTARPGEHGIQRFKMLVAGNADERYLDKACLGRCRLHVETSLGPAATLSAEAVAAAFLARVMKDVTRLVRSAVPADALRVMFNTCAPIDQLENRAILMAFERVAAAASILAQRDDWEGTSIADLEEAKHTLEHAQYAVEDVATRLFVVPEAVASFSTYLHSLSSREGLHALVDIGAGTTDVSIAYLAKPKRETTGVNWLAAGSIPLAGGQVEDDFKRALDSEGRAPVPYEELLRLFRAEDPGIARTARAISMHGLRRISDATRRVWGGAYGKYPGQRRWERQVTIFLSGGGAQLPGAREVFSETWYPKWGPWEVRYLPAPNDAPTVTGLGFERLSVAYGLCTRYAELGSRNRLPPFVEPVPREILSKHHEVERVEREPGGPT